jgi:uncharacterized protein YbaR (Trm112 family)
VDILACPHCNRSFVETPAVRGKTIRCRGCREVFHTPQDTTTVRPGPASPNAVDTGFPLLAVACFVDGCDARRCPACARTFLMRPTFLGKTIRCRGCKVSFRVEATPTTLDEASDIVEAGHDDARVAPAVRPQAVAYARDPSASPLAGMVAVVLGGVCALPITQLILWWGFDKDPMKLAAALPQAIQWLAPGHFQP